MKDQIAKEMQVTPEEIEITSNDNEFIHFEINGYKFWARLTKTGKLMKDSVRNVNY